jgi:predicted PurR-regulated permease PerM
MARAKTKKTELPIRRIAIWLIIFIISLGFLFLIRSILLPFIVGILIAYLLDPAADKLEEWGCSRGIATTILTGIFFAAVIIFLLAITPLLANQISGLIADLPGYIENFRLFLLSKLQHLPLPINWNHEFDMHALSEKLLNSGQSLTSSIIQSGVALINVISLLIITPVVSFYLLRDWDKMTAQIDELLPQRHAGIIRQQFKEIDRTLAGFIRGQLNVMLILGSFYAIALYLLGLKYAVIIGILAGLLIIIPYVGTFIGGISSVGIALIQFDSLGLVGAVLAIFIIGQMLEGYYLTPKLVGDRVGLHPVWIIFGMMAGGALFGFAGILIAVPVSAIIGVLMRFAIDQYEDSDLYRAE